MIYVLSTLATRTRLALLLFLITSLGLSTIFALTPGSSISLAPSRVQSTVVGDPTAICVNVFRDFDGDGVDDGAGEPAIETVIVTAYAADGGATLLTLMADGTYGFTPGNTDLYRIEVTGLGDFLEPSAAGATTTFFTSVGNTVNVGLLTPEEYLPSTSVFLTMPCYLDGANTGPNRNGDVLVAVPATSLGAGNGTVNPTEYLVARHEEIGSTFGVAYSRPANAMFAAAFTKRHTGFGPGGTGAIYRINLNGTEPTAPISNTGVSTFIDLNNLLGANAAGVNPHPNTSNFDRDPLTYDAVGKVGLGGLALAPENNVLWTINLADRKLYSLPLGGTLENPTPPLAADVASFPATGNLTNLPGLAGTAAQRSVNIRPFAVKYYRGEIYIGLVATGESSVTFNAANSTVSGTGDRALLRGYVYKFNPDTEIFTQLLNFPLNYPRGQAIDFCSNNAQAAFRPWTPVYDSARFLTEVSGTTGIPPRASERAYPQPWITDLEFDEFGRMIIGIRDRFADQHGYEKLPPNPSAASDPNRRFTADGAGDILLASLNVNDNTTYVLENNSSNGTNGEPFGPTRGINKGEGPGNGEFYFDDRYRPANAGPDGPNTQPGVSMCGDVNDQDPLLDPQLEQGHDEISLGGIANLNGRLRLIFSAYDPINNFNNFNNAGLVQLSSVDGARTGGNQIYATASSPGTFAKGNGLGDVEGVAKGAPIEVGNRVWLDVNENGVQDPGEPGLNGVEVSLFKNVAGSFVLVATTVTAASPVQGDGAYKFSNSQAPDQTWVGANNRVLPEMQYSIRVSLTSAMAVNPLIDAFTQTGANTTNNNKADLNDSDVDAGGSVVFTTGRAGQNNPTLDAGLRQRMCSIQPTASIACINGGGDSDASNDTYLITVGASANDGGPSNQYTVSIGGVSQGTFTFGTPGSFTLPADGSSPTLTFTDVNTPGCSATVGIGPLESCSLPPPNPCVAGAGNLGGVAFLDGNNDGAGTETGQPGIIVNVFDCAGMLVGTAVTGNEGEWFLPGLMNPTDTFRIEFSLPGDGTLNELQPGVAGADNGTSVQFATPGQTGACGINYGLIDPATVCPASGLDPAAIGELSSEGILLSSGLAVITCGSIEDVPTASQYTLGLLDLRNVNTANNRPATNPVDFHRADWTVTSLGNVFGTTIDSTGNFYATASSHYGAAFGYATGGNNPNLTRAVIRYGNLGGGAQSTAAAGAIYRMDAVTGEPTVFATLPQQSFAFTHIACEDGVTINRTSGPGLGNITFDRGRNQFFVSNFEDGAIYRLAGDGTIIDNFDPQTLAGFRPDDGTPGFANDFMPYGLALSPDGTRLYFGVHPVDNDPATSLEIANVYYVDLQTDGSFSGTEIFVVATTPDPVGAALASRGFNAFGADPGWISVSDLAFNPDGNLVIGHRTGCGDGTNPVYASSHNHGASYLIYDMDDGTLFNVETRYAGDLASNNGTGNDDVYGGIGIWNTNDGNYVYAVSSSDIRTEAGPHGIMVFPDDFTQTGNGTSQFILRPAAAIPYFSNFSANDFKGVGGDIDVYSPCGPLQIQIGNYVWFDLDEDGVQDPCEPPVTGLPVTLYTKDDDGTLTLIEGTTTDATTGEYYFNNVLPDTSYVIAFGANPSSGGTIKVNGEDYVLTGAGAGAMEGANAGTNSDGVVTDVNGAMFPAICYNTADTTDHTLDLGFVAAPLLSLGSTVFLDSNNNGIQDDADVGIGNVPIEVYRVIGLPDVTSGESDDELIALGSDGDQTTPDDGLPLVTDANGNYLAAGLLSGDYYVVIPEVAFLSGALQVTGYSSTDIASTNGDNQTDGDDNGLQPGGFASSVFSPIINLSADEEPIDGAGEGSEFEQGNTQDNQAPLEDASGDMTLDFGFFAPVTVGDVAFVDLNGDGLKTPDEPGIGGVTVTLLDADGATVSLDAGGNAITGTTVTAADGSYLFPNLPPGSYSVVFDISTADNAEFYTFTSPSTGEDVENDSDNNIVLGDSIAQSNPTNFLFSGAADLTLDVGLICNITVTVAEPSSICSTQSIDLTAGASISPATLGGFWSTPDGTGTFDGGTDFAAATTYSPSSADARRGSVTLVLTTSDPGAGSTIACGPISNSVTIEVLKVDCGEFFWGGGE